MTIIELLPKLPRSNYFSVPGDAYCTYTQTMDHHAASALLVKHRDYWNKKGVLTHFEIGETRELPVWDHAQLKQVLRNVTDILMTNEAISKFNTDF